MMKRRLLGLLDSVDDGLDLDQLPDLSPAERAELSAMLALAQQMDETLVLVQPRDAFRRALGTSLMTSARQQRSQAQQGWRHLTGRWKLAAAAAASGVSLGVITVIAVSRFRGNET